MNIEEKIGVLLKEKKLSLSTAESCTGGGIAALVT
ncbi:MAG: CinA family protein, partial [Bacteroides sp.]|nr:CinA family protein [Bacteroides sp.]